MYQNEKQTAEVRWFCLLNPVSYAVLVAFLVVQEKKDLILK